MELNKQERDEKDKVIHLPVQDQSLKSKNLDVKDMGKEVPSIYLAATQIEEIHADEYSLTLFYATRVQPLTLTEIKNQFPEPELYKAQSVLDRFIKADLIHITKDGKYYSNFPENYINYSNYRYDKDMEARKDAKVFALMKEFTGQKEYWKDKSYFSIDAFYTKEQTKELQEMFYQLKLKAKEYANENSKKKSIKDLIFRRLKFYDMTFSLLLLVFLSMMGLSPIAQAGGNDPTVIKATYYQDIIDTKTYNAYVMMSGGGNDPTMPMALMDSQSQFFGNDPTIRSNVFAEMMRRQALRVVSGISHGNVGDDGTIESGGGHDPICIRCPRPFGGGGFDPDKGGNAPKDIQQCGVVVMANGFQAPIAFRPLCAAQGLLKEMVACENSDGKWCGVIEDELVETLSQTPDYE